MKKLWTTQYHPQTNGLVERSHQTIMWIMGKLGEDKKAEWPGHLPEIVQAYNATRSTVMGYSPHYLMFGYRSQLPVNFHFPIFRSTEAPLRGTTNWGLPSRKHKPSQWQKPSDRNVYYDQKIDTMELKPGDLVLVKADAYKGKRKIKDRWEDEACEVVCQIVTMYPHTKWHTNVNSHASYTEIGFFSLHQRLAFPCMWVSTKHGTNVPAPPQWSQLPKGLKVRIHHE